ncbi:MAG TPA: autotransporter domain-containing protein [Bosea sp. (in: a-proteobacteria)]|uniref:autotransporter outer membrane beta-barrel domain-containing protein n=1 Tax=Bosea sp. (in: a-proteobacteria) TaxID=1871050 RepID=UPI002E13AD15|nr:autotransporter domain-containing protein [Bosea sp. (in: a-proteobacteria)]
MSAVALALGCGATTSAFAETFYVGNYSQLFSAVASANASADDSSTIILTQDITTTGNLSAPSKNLIIETNGFTINGLTAVPNARASLTLQGTFRGTSQAGAGGTAFIQGTTSAPSFITNSASVFGGASSTAGGGLGANLFGNVAFTNNGTIIGGNGVTQGGTGLQVRQVSTISNFGTIQGGDASSLGGGMGVDLGGPSGSASSLTNSGTIRGGSGPGNGVGGSIGGVGVLVRIGNNPIVNSGLIEGTNAAAIWANGATVSLDVVNSGTIRAGSGQNALGWQTGVTPTTGTLTLDLRAGSVIEGNVVANAAGTVDLLRLGGDANWTLDGGVGSAGQYRNFDTLEKTGTSTWTVSGSGDFAGATRILAGKLLVNGSLAGSAVMVASGATLGGSGAVGATTIATGGTIAPGNSIGTLTVNGAFVQAAGATYQVELDPGMVTSDLIKVNGTATLASGAALSVVNYTGAAYVPGQRYTVLSSTGLTGTYGLGEQALTAFLSLRDAYDANNAYLAVVQARSVGDVGGTPNEVEVGKSVDSLPAGNSVQTGVLNQPSIDAARAALNQLSGEIHASARTALIDESWLLRAAVNDRLRAAFGSVGAAPMATLNYGFTADRSASVKGAMPALRSELFAVWGQGYGSWGNADGDGNAAKMTRSTGGVLLGADAAVFDNLRFGLVAGYSRSDFDVTNRLSSGEIDNYHLGIYGGGRWGAINLRAGASYSWHDVETSRTVASAFLGGNPRASYDAGTAQIFGEAGYRMDVGRVGLEPFAGLTYVHLRTDGFSETGATSALVGQGDDTGVGYSTLGLRASTSFDLQGVDLTLRGGLAWRHAFGDVDPAVTLAFAGSNAFRVVGLPIARDSALVEAGLDVAVGRNATLGVAYTGQLAEDAQDHAFKGVLAVRF